MRRQKLDDLFARLAASTDVAETNGLVLAIDRLQLDSGSNTSDFLMARAIAAIETRSLATSLERSAFRLTRIRRLRGSWRIPAG